MLWMKKVPQEDQLKTFEENIFTLETSWNLLKLPGKWQEGIQTYGEYSIDRYLFIVTFFMNKLYLIKTKIIYDSTIIIYIYIYIYI